MMWWNHGFWGSGWGWPVSAVIAVAMLACMAVMVRMVMRHGSSRPTWEPGNGGEEPPEQILARRLAAGEIDVEEFEHLRDTLRQAGNSTTGQAEPGRAERHSLTGPGDILSGPAHSATSRAAMSSAHEAAIESPFPPARR